MADWEVAGESDDTGSPPPSNNWQVAAEEDDVPQPARAMPDFKSESYYQTWAQQQKDPRAAVDPYANGVHTDLRGLYTKYGDEALNGEDVTNRARLDEFALPGMHGFTKASKFAVGKDAARAGEWVEDEQGNPAYLGPDDQEQSHTAKVLARAKALAGGAAEKGKQAVSDIFTASPTQAAENLGTTTKEIVKGLGGSFNKLGETLALAGGVVPIAIDKIFGDEGSTKAQDWYFDRTVAPLIDHEEAFKVAKDAGFGDKVANGFGNILGVVDQAMVGGPEVAVETLMGRLGVGAASMSLPAVEDAVQIGREVLDQTGDRGAALKAAAAQLVTTMSSGAVPAAVGGRLATRLASGAAIGAGQSEASRRAMNAALPANMQTPYSPEQSLEGAALGAGFGAVHGAHSVAEPEAAGPQFGEPEPTPPAGTLPQAPFNGYHAYWEARNAAEAGDTAKATDIHAEAEQHAQTAEAMAASNPDNADLAKQAADARQTADTIKDAVGLDAETQSPPPEAGSPPSSDESGPAALPAPAEPEETPASPGAAPVSAGDRRGAAREEADRRGDLEQRKKVSEMSPEELRKTILSHELTDIPNKRAYEESEKLPAQASIDVDGLGWVNQFGHEAGDSYLKTFAQALHDELGGNAFHKSGDEFIAQGADHEELDAALGRVRDRLAGAKLEFTHPDGRTVTLDGVGFSHAIGDTYEDADRHLDSVKGDRQSQGLRAAKGGQPPNARVTPAETRLQADQGHPAPEALDELEQQSADRRGPQSVFSAPEGNATVNEPPFHGRIADTKVFGNGDNAQALRVHGFDSFNRQRQHMVLSQMGRSLNDPKVLRSVIQRVPVDVMHGLVGRDISTESLSRDPSVLTHRLAVARHIAVPESVSRFVDAVATALKVPSTLARTEKSSLAGVQPGLESVEPHAAVGAGKIDDGGHDIGSSEAGIAKGGAAETASSLPTIKHKGITLRIENRAGSVRRGLDFHGKPYASKMTAPYGYVEGTHGADGDAIDAFMGPHPESDHAFVIDQLQPNGHTFDEHKVVLGVKTAAQARALYQSNYQKGWKGAGHITKMSIPELKEWAHSDHTRGPVGWKPSMEAYAKDPELKDELRHMATTAGWAQEGGQNHIDTEGKFNHRTTWIPHEPWYEEAPDRLPAKEYPALIEKALAGKKLGARQERIVMHMAEAAGQRVHERKQQMQDLRDWAAAKPSAAELARMPEEELEAYTKHTADLQAMLERQGIRGEGARGPEDMHADIPFARSRGSQGDLFGHKVDVQNELKRLEAEKDKRRNSGQESVETGRPDDLFSQSRNQTDLTDHPQTDHPQLEGGVATTRLLTRASESAKGPPTEANFKRMYASATSKGLLAKHVEAGVHKFLSKFEHMPNAVKVFANAAELAQDPLLGPAIKARGADPAHVIATTYRGGLYFVADQIHSPEHLASLVAHEYITHHGLRAALGDASPAYDRILDGLAKDNPEVLGRHGAREFGERFDPQDPKMRRLAAEEMLAHYAENYVNGQSVPARARRWVQRAVALIRDWLRKVMGLPAKFDKLFMQRTLSDLESFLRDKASTGGMETAEAAMAQEMPTYFSALERAIETAKRDKGTGAEWEATLRNMPGVKGEEMDWLDLHSFLDGKGRVDKAEVLNYVREHRVEVQTISRGSARQGSDYQQQVANLEGRVRHLANTHGLITVHDAENGIRAIERGDGSEMSRSEVPADLGAALDEYDQLRGNGEESPAGWNHIDGGQYEEYTLPGDRTGYREDLLTLPKNERIENLLKRKEIFERHQPAIDAARKEHERLLMSSGRATQGDDAYESAYRKWGDLVTARDTEASPYYSDSYSGGHFITPNVVAHVRSTQRTDAEGKKVHFIEEIQSDWHQTGRKNGYLGDRTQEDAKALFGIADETWKRLTDEQRESYREEANSNAPHVRNGSVPHAPFKKTWHMLAFKHALRDAVEGGADKIAWTTGEQQNERYGLERHVKKISFTKSAAHYSKDAEIEAKDIGTLRVYSHTDRSLLDQRVHVSELAEHIGQELADRLLAQKPWRHSSAGMGNLQRDLMGLDVKMGGEGMRGFYDDMLPKEVGKYLKKFGGKVNKEKIPIYPDRQDWVDPKAHAQHEVHSVDITPQMREMALGGQPMFARTWHGTHAKFDRFDTAKMGSGSGAQTYGWGLYFADNPKTARGYAQRGAGGDRDTQRVMEEANGALERAGGDRRAAVVHLTRRAAAGGPDEQMLTRAAALVRAGNERPVGNLYQVDIPDRVKDTFLQRHLRMDEQPNAVLDGVIESYQEAGLDPGEINPGMPGEAAYARIRDALDGDRAASELLDRHGVHGLSYPDPEFRGNADRHFQNHVLFNAEHASVIDRNGKPVVDASERVEAMAQHQAQRPSVPFEGELALADDAPLFARNTPLSNPASSPQQKKGFYEKLRASVTALINNRVMMDIRKIVNPKDISPISKQVASMTTHYLGELARQKEETLANLERFARAIDKLPVAERLDMTHAIETGQAQGIPEMQPVADALRKGLDFWRDQVRSLGTGKLEHFIENYFPHWWADQGNAKRVFASIQGRRTMRGPATFLKKRVIPTKREGMQLGLTPVTTNPLIEALMKIHEMQRYISGVKMMEAYKGAGLAKFIPASQHVPDGWREIDDPIARVSTWSEEEGGFVFRGRYAMPEDGARVINNHLSSSALQNFAPAQVIRIGSNLLNALQLGFSAFHLGFTTLDAMISTNAVGIERMLHGEPIKAAAAFLQGMTPVGAALNLTRGIKLMRAYANPAGATPEMRALVDGLVRGGGRTKMDRYFEVAQGISPFHGVGAHTLVTDIKAALAGPNKFAGTVKAIGSFPLDYAQKLKNDLVDITKTLPVFQWPFEIAGRMTRATTAWMMEHVVPWQKLGVFSQMASDHLRRNPSASPEELNQSMQAIWRSVDNRLGEMVYNNKFWQRTFKDTLHFMVRAVGWNDGTIEEVGGAPVDFIKLLDKAVREGKVSADDVGHKIPYVMAMVATASVLGAVIQYLAIGQMPQEPIDYIFPRTGGVTKMGTPERMSLPSYMKDVWEAGSHPGQQIANKLNPIWAMASQIWSNADYFGNAIYDPGAPLKERLSDQARFIGKEFTPFSIQGAKQFQPSPLATKLGAAMSLLPSVGLTPAPGKITSAEQIERRDIADKEKSYQKGLRYRIRQAHEAKDLAEEGRLKQQLRDSQERSAINQRGVRQDYRRGKAAQPKTPPTSKLLEEVAPIIDGSKNRQDMSNKIRAAGYPALAGLLGSMPERLRPSLKAAMSGEAA